MMLYHVSPCPSLKTLRPDKARTKRKVSWLCHIGSLDWAIQHVARRHKVHHVYLYQVEVPYKNLRRHSWYAYLITKPMPALRIFKNTVIPRN